MVHKINKEEIPKGLGVDLWYIIYYKNKKPYLVDQVFPNISRATQIEDKIFRNKKVKGTYVDNVVVDARRLI